MARPRKADAVVGALAPAAVALSADMDYMKRPLESVDVQSLSGEHLKRYAKRAGISQRDIDNLTPDRLRQNIKIAIANHFDLLTE